MASQNMPEDQETATTTPTPLTPLDLPSNEVRDSTGIILCRGDSIALNDYYESVLKDSYGFYHVRHLPLLEFRYIADDKLAHVMKNCHREFHGLVFTSVRAVFAVERCLQKEFKQCLQDWKDKLVFAVGPKTCQEVESHFGFKVTITDPDEIGNSRSLAESIARHFRPHHMKKMLLLMPCSSSAPDEFPALLSNFGVDVAKLPAYDTHPVPDAANRLMTAVGELSHMKRIIVVLFSPSNVKSVSSVLSQISCYSSFSGPRVYFVAIGPTTEKSLLDFSLPVFCVSSKPDPVSLAQSISNKLYQMTVI